MLTRRALIDHGHIANTPYVLATVDLDLEDGAALGSEPTRGHDRRHATDDASHLMMGPGPGMIAFGSGPYRIEFGGTAEGTLRARDDAWAMSLAFMGFAGLDKFR